MRKRLCPQCKIANFYVLTPQGERRLVYVSTDFEVLPSKLGESLEGFDTETIYCLGCSWSGSPKRTVKY